MLGSGVMTIVTTYEQKEDKLPVLGTEQVDL